MSTPPAATPEVRRIDRILAFMALGILALAVICFLIVIIATASGVSNFDGGVWPVLFVLQLYGPVVSFVLLLALLIMNFSRRSRTGTSG